VTLVAGVDSSTQACKVVICDADTGAVVRSGAAPHPGGTEIAPDEWRRALDAAFEAAGGLADVAAVSIAAQQHGMVGLDDGGAVVRDALLWNDLRSAEAAEHLVAELPGGRAGWAEAVGSVPLASFTVAKLRWLAEHEPRHLARTAAVCLPHDWLTWTLAGSGEVAALTTDRSDASGTGYWSPRSEAYRTDLIELACGTAPEVPRVLAPWELAGTIRGSDAVLGCGAGDNAAAALAVGLGPGDVLVSLGTSGVACAVHAAPTADASGAVAGFADATGRYLPLVCTLNATRVFDAVAAMLGVDRAEMSRLALSAEPGASGVTIVPYWEGERTPNRPFATGAVHGLTLANSTSANLARAAIEGVLCGLADGIDALRAQGVALSRVVLVGGGSRSEAVRRIGPTVLGVPVCVPALDEPVACGAARQAAWARSGASAPPEWPVANQAVHEATPAPFVRERYARVREFTATTA
jgi:xylulokinase